MNPTPEAFEKLACAALRGEAPAWPFGSDAKAAAGFIAHCAYHGVGPLVREHLADQPVWATWHGAVREGLDSGYKALVALEMLRQQETQGLLDRCSEAGIDAILLKGTALAYGLYREPALRSRTDTDLLIAPAAKDKTFLLLQAQGYASPNAISGKYVSTQKLFMKQGLGLQHAIDLHWQISNAQVFAQQFPFDELWRSAIAVPRLGAAAKRLSAGYALLHACLHRAVHAQRGEQDRLQWFYDMHLLAAEMDCAQWDAFAERARQKGMAAICVDALQRCMLRLHTQIPAQVMHVLDNARGQHELSAPLLTAGGLRSVMINFRALPTWRARARLLREHALPDASYMRARYGVNGVLPLTRAYIARLLKAPGKLLARPKQDTSS